MVIQDPGKVNRWVSNADFAKIDDPSESVVGSNERVRAADVRMYERTRSSLNQRLESPNYTVEFMGHRGRQVPSTRVDERDVHPVPEVIGGEPCRRHNVYGDVVQRTQKLPEVSCELLACSSTKADAFRRSPIHIVVGHCEWLAIATVQQPHTARRERDSPRLQQREQLSFRTQVRVMRLPMRHSDNNVAHEHRVCGLAAAEEARGLEVIGA